MSTADNKRAVMVGIFIFLGIVIFVAGILTLGGQQKRFVSSVEVTAVFNNVEGLRAGNNVWFSGVKVGTINRIRLLSKSEVEVVMHIEEASQQYIRQDAVAKIGSESLIGNRIIEIYNGTAQAPAIVDGSRLKVESGLSTDDLMATLQENNKNLVDITTDLKKLSNNLVNGQGTVGALLTDSLLADKFRQIVSGLQQTSTNTVQASRSLQQFTSKLNNSNGLVDQLLTDTAVFNQLQHAVAQLDEASKSAADMTRNLQENSQKLNNSNNALGTLLNDEAFAEQLKTTMQNLESSTYKLDQNMEALQHNIFFRGFFRKKAESENQQK